MESAQATLARFFDEKNLPVVAWDIEVGSLVHIIDSAFVIDLILNHCSAAEQSKILDVIVRIDFANGDVNHFLGHLAEGYVKQQQAG